MMINRAEKQRAADPVTQAYEELETQIMQNIIRHVQNYGQLIDSDEWLLQKLAELGKLNKEHIQLIAKAAGANRKAVEEMCYDVADLVLARVEPGLTAYDRVGVLEGTENAVPVHKSKNIQKAVNTVFRQAWDALNKCNTDMLYLAQDAYQSLVQGIVEKAQEIANKQEFLDILGKHATAEAVGAESRGQAICSVIREFNEKGIPAFVDKAGRKWTPEAYVGMTLRSTAGNVATEAMFARMKDRDLNLLQVSSHSGARPKCARDQGKVFDLDNESGYTTDGRGKKVRYYPWRSSSYGEPDGLFGINCGHHGTPFLPGVSSRRYFPTDDFAENDRLYKQMQTQRGLERDVRKQKRLCSLYDEIGDSESFEQAAVTLKSKEARLAAYTKQNGLTRRRDREQVYGFDRRVSAEAVGKAQTHYKRWARSIGAESGPKTLAGYYDLKYNGTNESRLYKGYVSAVNVGRISPLVGYDTFRELARQAEKRLVGLKTSDGLEVAGITAHFVDRMIGQQSADSSPRPGIRNGVQLSDIEAALTEPKKIGKIVEDAEGRKSKRYYGDSASVSMNPDTRELIQVQPRRQRHD